MPPPGRPALALLTALLAQPAWGATVHRSPNPYGDETLTLDGTIDPADAETLAAAIRETEADGKRVRTIQLDSGGGNLGAGWAMALAVRSSGIATAVPDGATCASACFVIFAAGTARIASLRSRIGVHGASERNGADTDQSKAATVEMAKLVKDLGVPDGIIGKMVTTPPKSMMWLTRDDMRSMGVTLADTLDRVPQGAMAMGATAPPGQSPGSVPTAAARQSLGAVPTSPFSAPGAWERLAERAVTLSAAQHGGVAARSDVCDTRTKACIAIVLYTEANGSPALLRTTSDARGAVMSRVYCSLDTALTQRSCLDIATGTVTAEARGPDGHWARAGGG